MEASPPYRSYSASRSQSRSIRSQFKMNIAPLALWKLKEKVINPEKDTDMDKLAPQNPSHNLKEDTKDEDSENPNKILSKNRTAI